MHGSSRQFRRLTAEFIRIRGSKAWQGGILHYALIHLHIPLTILDVPVRQPVTSLFTIRQRALRGEEQPLLTEHRMLNWGLVFFFFLITSMIFPLIYLS
jgi:hypothetical protein